MCVALPPPSTFFFSSLFVSLLRSCDIMAVTLGASVPPKACHCRRSQPRVAIAAVSLMPLHCESCVRRVKARGMSVCWSRSFIEMVASHTKQGTRHEAYYVLRACTTRARKYLPILSCFVHGVNPRVCYNCSLRRKLSFFCFLRIIVWPTRGYERFALSGAGVHG